MYSHVPGPSELILDDVCPTVSLSTHLPTIISCLLQLALLAARDEDARAVLHERLGGHLAEPRGAARHQHDVVAEVEEGGHGELRGRRHFEWFSAGQV